MSALNNIVDDLVGKVFDNTLVSAAELAIDATYKSVVTGAYSPSTGSIGRTDTDIAVKIIKKGENTSGIGGISGISQASTTRSGNENVDYLEFLVRPVSGVLPNQGIDDELTVDSRVYKILDVQSVNMGSNRLLYKIKALG